MVRRSVSVALWTDAWFEDLEPNSKLIWLYLLTHPNSNMIGIFDISEKRTASDCGLDREDVRKAFEGFAKDSKAFVKDSKIWIVNFVKHQSYNTNTKTNARNAFFELDSAFLQWMNESNTKAFESLTEAFGNPFEGLPNPSTQDKRREVLREDLREEKLSKIDSLSHARAESFPTLESVLIDCRAIGCPDEVARTFYSRMSEVGWMVARGRGDGAIMVPLQDWRAYFRRIAKTIESDIRTQTNKLQKQTTSVATFDDKVNRQNDHVDRIFARWEEQGIVTTNHNGAINDN
jgi:hypothetical protein